MPAQEIIRSEALSNEGKGCTCGRGTLIIRPTHDAMAGNGEELVCTVSNPCGFRRTIVRDPVETTD
ncbi:MAG: hypothetical protein WC808_04725 [Patescibacteria group bacterium]